METTEKIKIEEFELDGGWMLAAPIWERHKRGKNWLAIVAPDPGAPGGMARDFQGKSNSGSHTHYAGNLRRGAFIEFGADYISSGGKKHRSRKHYVVISITDSELQIAEVETRHITTKKGRAEIAAAIGF